MTTDFSLVRQILNSQLKEAILRQAPGDSIRIHQVADPIDMTRQAADHDVAVQIINRESAIVRGLRSAIDRISDGSYGICLQCEGEIAPKRLKAIPWAELCLHCQEQADALANQRESLPVFDLRRIAA